MTTYVIVERNTISQDWAIVRIPLLGGELIPVRVQTARVSPHNISGFPALAEYYRPKRKFQRSNFVPYSIRSALTARDFGDLDISFLDKRFSDIKPPKNEMQSRFVCIAYKQDGKRCTVIGIKSFNSGQCIGSFSRSFHKRRENWKIPSIKHFTDQLELGVYSLDYASRFTRKLVAEEILPREEQWKKQLRTGIQ